LNALLNHAETHAAAAGYSHQIGRAHALQKQKITPALTRPRLPTALLRLLLDFLMIKPRAVVAKNEDMMIPSRKRGYSETRFKGLCFLLSAQDKAVICGIRQCMQHDIGWLASAGFCWKRLIESIINLEVSDEFSRSCVRSWFFPGCFHFGQCQNFHRSPECPGFRKV
jgi:hypothetical protein